MCLRHEELVNMADSLTEPVCLEDFESYARQNLPNHAFEFFAGGANEETTIRENVEAFKRLRIRPRVLCGISEVDLSTTVLGEKVSLPIGIAPTATQKLAHPDGEQATAKAASKAGTCMILSCVGSTSLEDVATMAPESVKWLQLYVLSSQEMTKKIVKRAEKEGYKAIVMTVDATVRGKRQKDVRNHSFLLPHLMNIPNVDPAKMADAKRSSDFEKNKQRGSGFAFDNFAKTLFNKSITFETIDWLKSITKLPVLVKGILTADDARKAVQHGVDGIIVSNHGGRQLDCVPATIDVLPEIVDAVNGKVEVYVDGGIRLGTDVFKALALGARAVFIGRPAIWGLAYKGEEGVTKVLDILKEELEIAMILSGIIQNLHIL
ncbi:unnamed protein product [Porites lobata]|uniref:FMN hydroxy acid dehydrogenase domain-containing protein n=1 Tax=Porites lobata TaxID=104759 RepID=A0ABN8NU32_9CNID|nr:unnamed protein product [Porites lobata]